MASESYKKEYSKYYDLLREDKDYKKEIDFLEKIFKKYSKFQIRNILDLGCGTGNHCNILTNRGYYTIGIDSSEGMIEVAKSKNILNAEFFLGDMKNFELNKKFDSVISMYAAIGYLNKNKEIESLLQSVKKHLNFGGLFIFDCWNGLCVMKEGPSSRRKEVEKENLKIIRESQPELNAREHVCKVKFNVETKRKGELIEKFKEEHNVRFFFPQEIIKYLEDAGFEVVEICPSYKLGEEVSEKNWWIQIIARLK